MSEAKICETDTNKKSCCIHIHTQNQIQAERRQYFVVVVFLNEKEKDAHTSSFSKHWTVCAVLHDRNRRELSHGLFFGMHGQNKYKQRASERGELERERERTQND